MPESIWILVFSILVVVAVFLFRRFALPVTGLGALFLTILACVIAAAIYIFIVGDSVLGLVSAFIIYTVSNFIFQIIQKLQNSGST